MAKDNPEQFWGEQANKLAWYQKPASLLKKLDQHHYQWFSDGVMNTCYMALDHQIEQGRGNQTALIYDSPVTGTSKNTVTSSFGIKWHFLRVCLKPMVWKKVIGPSFICR